MSTCTFIIISKEEHKYCINHYSVIEALLKGERKPEDVFKMPVYIENIFYESDTGFIPAVIIDFDKKILINTSYNWFDDFKKYLSKEWKYKEFKAEICEGCGYSCCQFNVKNCKELKGGLKE